jgi:hypothetical protein
LVVTLGGNTVQWIKDNWIWISVIFSGIGVPAIGFVYKKIVKLQKSNKEDEYIKMDNSFRKEELNGVKIERDVSGGITINNYYNNKRDDSEYAKEESACDSELDSNETIDEENVDILELEHEDFQKDIVNKVLHESTITEINNLILKIDEYFEKNAEKLPKLNYTLNSIELKKYKEDLLRMKNVIEQQKFRIVFIGPTRVGKTTTICYLFDLFIEKNGNFAELFKVQGGNCTPCNTIIKNSDKTKIIVTPMPKNEFKRLLKKYCSESLNEDISLEQQTQILSEEARGILDIIIDEKNIDIDELAKSSNINGQGLYDVVEKLIELEKYTEDKIIIEFEGMNSTSFEELNWIQEKVIEYTSGNGENCIIPESITVEINKKVKELPDFVAEIVDTRGLYEIEFNEDEDEEPKDKNSENGLIGFSNILNRDDLRYYIEDSETMVFFVSEPQQPQNYLKEYFDSLLYSKYVEDILRNHIIINLDKDDIALEINNKNRVKKKKVDETELIENKEKTFKNKILNLQKQSLAKMKKNSKQSWIIDNWEKNEALINDNSIEYINCLAIDSLRYLRRNTECRLEFMDLKNKKEEMKDYRNKIIKKIQDSFKNRKKIVYIEIKQLCQQVNKLLDTDLVIGTSENAYKEFLNNMRVFTELYSKNLCDAIISAVEESACRHGNHWKSIITYILWHQGYKDIYANEIIWYVRNEINQNLKNYVETSDKYINEFADKLSNITVEEKNEIVQQVANVIKIVCDGIYDDFMRNLMSISSTLYGDANEECITYWSNIRDKYERLQKKPSIKSIVEKELRKQRLEYDLNFNKKSKYDDFIIEEVKYILNHKVMEQLENGL